VNSFDAIQYCRALTIEEPNLEPPRMPMMGDSKKYIGKHLLAAITYLNDKGEVVERVQLHGMITRVDEMGIFFAQANGEEFSLPPDTDSLEPAKPGIWQLRSTGESVENPDFISSWTVNAPPSVE
jgi:hypothetical protein